MPTTADTGFTAEERAAMKARARELKAEAKAAQSREAGDRAVRDALAELPEPDRTLGEGLHALVTDAAPMLMPRLWYGMPAYARDGKIVCFFQAAAKFNARYATFGFTDQATLDDGPLWPTAFAITSLEDAEAAQIRALVAKAVA